MLKDNADYVMGPIPFPILKDKVYIGTTIRNLAVSVIDRPIAVRT